MPNRYLLTDYSPAELAALTDEPLLWWLVWQACGCEVRTEFAEGRHDIKAVAGRLRWWANRRQPEADPDYRPDTCYPNFETVVEALDEWPSINVFREGREEWVCELSGILPHGYSANGPSPYLAAARALLQIKRREMDKEPT